MFLKTFCGVKKISLILAVLFLNLLVISPALAQTPAPSGGYVPLVAIPGVNPNAGVLTYLSGLYSFLISVVGILAMAVIIYGGLRYLTSAGNPGAVGEAKDAITSAVVGLILALASWIILSTINPDFLVLKPVGVNQFGGYAYNSATNKCSVDPAGQGTGTNPCTCVDGKKITVGKKNAILNFSITPTVQSASTSVTLSGKLTDAATGAGIGGATLDLYKFNAAVAPNKANIMGGVLATNADGTFSGMTTSTCGGTEQWQMYFPGNGTYAPVASGTQSVTFTNPPGSPCAAGNYPTDASPLATNLCEAACSDTTLASDGAFHCLVVRPKISTVSDVAIMTYNTEQIRALAVYDGTADNPFIIPDQSSIVVDVLNNSISYNNPVVYTLDDGFTGDCNPSAVLLQGMWRVGLAYSSFSGDPACKATITPKGVTCSQKYCATDSKGNVAESILYFTVLAPN